MDRRSETERRRGGDGEMGGRNETNIMWERHSDSYFEIIKKKGAGWGGVGVCYIRGAQREAERERDKEKTSTPETTGNRSHPPTHTHLRVPVPLFHRQH